MRNHERVLTRRRRHGAGVVGLQRKLGRPRSGNVRHDVALCANGRSSLDADQLDLEHTATFGGNGVRGSAPYALSDGSTTSHFEPAGICASTSRIAGISISLSFMAGIFCAGRAWVGCWPHGYGPATSSCDGAGQGRLGAGAGFDDAVLHAARQRPSRRPWPCSGRGTCRSWSCSRRRPCRTRPWPWRPAGASACPDTPVRSCSTGTAGCFLA